MVKINNFYLKISNNKLENLLRENYKGLKQKEQTY